MDSIDSLAEDLPSDNPLLGPGSESALVLESVQGQGSDRSWAE